VGKGVIPENPIFDEGIERTKPPSTRKKASIVAEVCHERVRLEFLSKKKEIGLVFDFKKLPGVFELVCSIPIEL